MRRTVPALVLASWACPALAGGLARGSAPSIPWLRVMLAFALCIALAWGAVVVLRHCRRRGVAHPLKALFERRGRRPARRITVIETRRASVHADLCLVECDEEVYFLALTSAGATVLKRPDPSGPAR